MQPTTHDPVPSHLDSIAVLRLARSMGAQAYELGVICGAPTIRLARAGIHRDFAATPDGIWRAGPIRLFLAEG